MSTQEHTSEFKYHVTSNIIAASAGTGKTYQLASRYIALLVLGARPEEIIALTFTRKAAGEFRNRILHALAEGACHKDTAGRNPLTIRVWDVLSGLTIDDHGKAVPASNPVPLLPVTTALLKRAEEKGCYPEDLYHEDKELQKYYGFPEPGATTFARLLKEMVAVLSRLRLTTIDSFFASLVTTNSMELGMNSAEPLDPNDETKVQSTAIRDYLDAQGSEQSSRREFLRMFSLLTRGVGNRTQSRIAAELKSFLSVYRALPESTRWGDAAAFGEGDRLNVASDAEMAHYQSLCEQLRQLIKTHGAQMLTQTECNQLNQLADGGLELGKTAAKRMANVHSDYPWLPELSLITQSLDTQAPLTPELAQTAEKAREAATLYGWAKGATAVLEALGANKPCNNKNYLSAFRKAVQNLHLLSESSATLLEIKQIVSQLLALAGPCRLRQIADQTVALKSLLEGYAATYEQRMLAEGRLSFADIARLAKELMLMDAGDSRLLRHHVAYRMGGELHHWMLDEFQDTSEDQFATLKPLLHPIANDARAHAEDYADEQWQSAVPASLQGRLEHGTHHVTNESIFVVGDVKQSIYGFRTGKTEVFDRLKTEDTWNIPLQESELTRSFRSSPVIMGKDGFVNTLFRALHGVECPAGEAPGCIGQEPVTHLADFTHHEAARADMPGYVEITAIAPPDKDDNEDDSTIRTRIYDAITSTLQKLTDAACRPLNNMSIAILVRSNTEADEIMAHLAAAMPQLPLLLVKDTLAAAACPLGEMLLCFFRWLLHPSDAAALGIVRASFLGRLIHGSAESARADFLREWQISGYAALLDSVLAPLDYRDRSANDHVIRLWRNNALAADTTGLSLAEWVNRMKHLSQQGISSAGAVQIMTMHKSKGLEFDAVILPYCSKEAVDATKKLSYFVNDDGTALLLPPGSKEELASLSPAFPALTARWQKEQRKEAYNLLYVATTRARHANYIICHGNELFGPESKNSKNEIWKSAARSTAGLIRQAIADIKERPEFIRSFDADQVIYTHPGSTPDWYESLGRKDDSVQSETTPAPLPLGPAIPRRKRSNPSTLAKAEDKPTREAEEYGKSPHADYGDLTAAEFGTLVHAAWEEIIWYDARHPDWMQKNEPRTAAQSVVYDALHQPEIRALFTHRPGQEVYNEQRIEAIDAAKNEWLSGIIDRLVLTTDDAGEVTAAHIIDFKTNQLDPEALKWEHTAQMKAYRELIEQAFGLPGSAVAVTLLSCPLGVKAQLVPC